MSENAPVAVVGLGLVGGSVARALKRLADPPRVLGADLEPGRTDAALKESVVDLAGDAAEIVRDARTVVYATPLSVIVDQVRTHARSWREDALVMDVGSLKAPVRDAVVASNATARWVGAHPMAGSERTGFEAARADLFDGARVWLTRAGPTPGPEPRAERFWASLGAHPQWVDVDLHDRTMAAVSHLPQVAANALASVLEDLDLGPDALGPGGRDMTRLAGSSPTLWRPLLEASAPHLAPLIARLVERLREIEHSLRDGRSEEFVDLMAQTRAWRGPGPWT